VGGQGSWFGGLFQTSSSLLGRGESSVLVEKLNKVWDVVIPEGAAPGTSSPTEDKGLNLPKAVGCGISSFVGKKSRLGRGIICRGVGGRNDQKRLP